MKDKKIAVKKGHDHMRRGVWSCELPVPDGYRIIENGKTEQNDLVMVMVPPFPERIKRGTVAKIKGKWEAIERDNIGVDVRSFHAVVRKNESGAVV